MQKKILQKLIKIHDEYQRLNDIGIQQLSENKFDSARSTFNQAYDIYILVTQDPDILVFFEFHGLTLWI